MDYKRSILTFVLRKGRMTTGQQKAYDTLFEKWSIPFASRNCDFSQIFGNDHPLIMEIGFGMGHATAEIAEQNPQYNYLAIDVYKPGVGKLLQEIDQRGLTNIRIIEYDALSVLEEMVCTASLAGVHVFFPDPWQKKRQHKRRLMQRPHTDLLASRLQNGGYLYMVTDWQDYAEHALTELQSTQGLYSPYEGFAPMQPWRPKTKFEQKGLQKEHTIYELLFMKDTLTNSEDTQ